MPVLDVQRLLEAIGRQGPNLEALGDALDRATTGNPYMNTAAKATKIGGEILGAGVVLNPKNAEGIRAAIVKAIPKTASEAEIALEFVRQKYPKLFCIGGDVKIEPPAATITPGGFAMLKGSQVPTGTVKFNPRGLMEGASKKVTLHDWATEPIENKVETLAHELTHAKQTRRDPIGINTSYIPASHSFEGYKGQKWETEARKGGAIGKAALEKFLNLLSANEKTFPGETPVDKDFINEVMMPLAAKRLAADESIFAERHPETLPIAKENLRSLLARAAKTATGNVDPWQIVSLQDAIGGLAQYDYKDDVISLLSQYLRKRGATDLQYTGSREFLKDYYGTKTPRNLIFGE